MAKPSPSALLSGIPGLVWAYRFDPNGAAELLKPPIDASLPDARRRDGTWLWLHFSLADARARDFISRMDLSERARSALLTRDVHSNLHLEGDTAFGAFVDWHYEPAPTAERGSQDPVALGHLRFALSEGLIVSARLHPLQSVEAIRRQIDAGTRVSSAGHMIEAVVEEFANAVAQACLDRMATLDDTEDRVLDDALSDERRDLGTLRRKSVRLHRPLHGLKRVLDHFEQRHGARSSHPLLAAAARLSQRVNHVEADVVTVERRARMLQEEVAAKLTEQTNRQLYVLSILTALFLPPTLVAGFFGMNTGGLPLAQEPYGSVVAGGLGICSSVVVGWVLRRRGVTPR